MSTQRKAATPQHIQQAKKKGDIAYLQEMGRLGAKRRLTNLDMHAAYFGRKAQQRFAEERARIEQANEHIVPLSVYE